MKRLTLFLIVVGVSLIFLPQVSADLNDGLVAYYPFIGNANDESGNGNDGTVYGATLAADRFGTADNAYSFDGVDDYIDCGNASIFNMHDEITLGAWVKASSFENAVIISKWKTENWYGSWMFRIDDEGKPRFCVTGDGFAGGFCAISDITIDIGSFHHLAGVYNISDNIIRIFVDGIERGAAAGQSGSIYVSNSRIYIGAADYYIPEGHRYFYFNGTIDNVRIYNRVLSESEIRLLSSVSPPVHHFGIIEAGCPSTQTFTLENVSNANQTIGTLSVTGPDSSEFDLQNDNCSGQTVIPEGTCTFDVVFQPSSIGSKQAAAEIPFTDPPIGPLSVPLSGLVTDVCECDLNQDHTCDMQDWLVFGQDWGRTDCNDPGAEECECDLNDDGKCDMQDWLLFGQDWGRVDCPVCP